MREEHARRRRRPGRQWLRAGALMIVALMLATCFSPLAAAAQFTDGSKNSMAGVSQDFARYQQSKTSPYAGIYGSEISVDNGSPFKAGLRPNPVSLSHLEGQDVSDSLLTDDADWDRAAVTTARSRVGLPYAYDLRTLDKVTAVRDQNPLGTCWAFGTMASLESYLMPGEARDFSENNMKNLAGFDGDPNNDGGNHFMTTAYLARWSGPVDESDDPYSISLSSPVLPAEKHVQDVLFLPARGNSLDNDNLKTAIMTYGAVYSTYYTAPAYYNNVSYYYTGGSYSNHAIALVGWDDGYDRNKFSPAAPGDGAFIVKNSWGDSWGDAGYFYISYYDSRIGEDNAVFTAESAEIYNHIYQYDWLGWVASMGYGTDTAWFAANYTATGDQELEAAGFYTGAVDSEYLIRVYRNEVLQQTTSGTIAVPGYHTVRFDSSVPLEAGQPFRIEVRLRTPGYDYPIPVEYAAYGYSSRAVQNSSETFYSPDGVNWYDAATNLDASMCLKAYTTDRKISFSQPAYTAGESSGSATITVNRIVSSDTASVDYAAVPGNATARDFTPVGGTLTFGVGEASQTFSVPIAGDQLLEGSETVTLTLSNPSAGYHVDGSTATLWITDDETQPASIPALLSFSTGEADGSLSVIDTVNSSVIATLDAGDGPYGVAVSPGGAYAYVTDNASGRLQVVSARNLSELQSIGTGSRPHGVTVSPNGSLAAVADSGDDTVSLIDLRSLTVSHTVNVGQGPEAAAFSPDGSTVYAVNKADGSVSVINAGSGSVSSTITVGTSPRDVAVAPNGVAYVTNYGSNNISVINGARVVTTLSLAGEPHDIVLSPEGSRAYVSFPAQDKIEVLSLPAGTVERTINTVAPRSLGLSQDGRTLHAAGADNNIITAFQVPEGSPAGTITAGTSTAGIAFAPEYHGPALQFASTSYSVSRSDPGLTITVRRDGSADEPTSAGLRVSGGNATAGVDYLAPPANVQIPAGAGEATFDLTILDYIGRDKTLTLTLTDPATGTSVGGNATTAITIESGPVSYTVNLKRGWNLMSVPVVPANSSITSVIPPSVMADTKIVWVYDNVNPQSPWRFYKPSRTVNSISDLTYGTGFWIYVYNDTTLTFTGTIPEDQTVPIGTGWNLIGPTSTTTKTPAELYSGYYITWGYENGQWYFYKPSRTVNTLPAIKPGYGYWVKRV